MNNLQIISTADGSHSLLNTALNETYHSVHGALQESLHVFIKNGLEFFCERSAQTPVRILEIGFGTGLNALLAAQRASAINRNIHYTTLEAFPLPQEIWSQLNYADSVAAKDLFQKIHAARWSEDEVISSTFTLLKREITVQLFEADALAYDVVFFDAFAPGKQPEMWFIDILEKVVQKLTINGVFVTYCAKGQLKRDLKSLNMVVETLNGPPGKKEMVRALKIS
jgi:tRNA U34 5-methylaminomethyl-2-thiouridine-forming methyltransferase MnmC